MSADGLHRQAYRRLVGAVRARAGDPPVVEVAYVLPVGADVHNVVSRLQLQLLRTCGSGIRFHETPHITLKLSFKTADVDPFVEHVDTLAREVDPFEIDIAGIDFFDAGIMFLGVGHNAPLELFRQRILTDLSTGHGVQPYDIEGPRFRPHVTVAHDLSRRSFARARRLCSEPIPELRFVPDELALMCHTGEQWFVCHRARIAGRPTDGGVRS